MGLAAGVGTFLVLSSVAAVTSLAAAVPPAVAGGCIVGLGVARPAPDSRVAWVYGLPGLVSLVTTATVLSLDQELTTRDGLYGLVETAMLFVLLATIVRWLPSPRVWVCGMLTAAGQISWILRFLPDRDLGAMVGACALWSIPSIVAVVVGGYPRLAASRLRNSVASARAEQRRALERDMHDYVAHDVTAMIVQAQAAQYAAGDDPERLRNALRRIEESGQRAMSSMDRALELLRGEDPDAASRLRHPGLEDLDRLVKDFAEAGGRGVRLSIDGALDGLPREVSETLYRVSVEALTNVRRHAPTAGRVTIDLVIVPDSATLSVRDDGRRTGSGRRSRGGSGLRNAQARVEALDGTFTAVAEESGWQVHASLPLRPDPPSTERPPERSRSAE